MVTPNRQQVEFRAVNLDGLLPPDHLTRLVWDFVLVQDLGELCAGTQSVEGAPGRATADPRVLLALRMYATLEGVGSTRALDRLTKASDAYRCLCDRVPMIYHAVGPWGWTRGAA